jgi:hypothetical protein
MISISFQFDQEVVETTDFIVIFRIELSHDILQYTLYILTFLQCQLLSFAPLASFLSFSLFAILPIALTIVHLDSTHSILLQ